MSRIEWDSLAERYFQSGIDRGVLYLDAVVVPWNGLISVEEDLADETSNPYFVDGVKFLDVPLSGDYKSTLHSFTYPDEFLPYIGYDDTGGGLSIDSQGALPFGLSYRTRAQSASGEDAYQVHICYNVTAVQGDADYKTQSDATELVTFDWSVIGAPVEAPGYRPTSHIILDSRYVYPYLLREIEDILYGTDEFDPVIPELSDLLDMAINWYLIDVVDNGDGTFSVTGPSDLIFPVPGDPTMYTIQGAEIVYDDVNTYEISDTYTVH